MIRPFVYHKVNCYYCIRWPMQSSEITPPNTAGLPMNEQDDIDFLVKETEE